MIGLATRRVTGTTAALDILIQHRRITWDDDSGLLPEETSGRLIRDRARRRQSGAARIAARSLFSQLGLPPAAIPTLPSGAPNWPIGVIGSLAHDETMAVAAVARRRHGLSIGIDIEPAESIEDELVPIVATPLERRRYSRQLLGSRLLFVAKEATFKAAFPLDGNFLDFHDIEIDLDMNRARTKYGLDLCLEISCRGHITVLAVHDQGRP